MVIKCVNRYEHNLFDDKAWFVFNVNHNPFSFSESSLWAQRRRAFYRIDNTSKLTNDFLTEFYNKLFNEMKLTVNELFFIDRNSEYLSYCCVELEK